MDRQTLAMLIPIVALCIPIVGIIAGTILKLEKERTAAARLQAAPDPGLLTELEELRGEVHQLRGELTEVQERLDFTERLLTQRSDRSQLPQG